MLHSSLLPYYNNKIDCFLSATIEKILNKHKQLNANALDVNDLQAHIDHLYSVAQAHYEIAKESNMNHGMFPQKCCGESSHNIFFSTLMQGYSNSAIAYSEMDGELHSYLLFPFMWQDQNTTLVLDPTSDQYGHEKNLMFIHFDGEQWDEAKLPFPSRVTHIGSLPKLMEYQKQRQWQYGLYDVSERVDDFLIKAHSRAK